MKNPKIGEKIRAYIEPGVCVIGNITCVAADGIEIELSDLGGNKHYFDRRQCVRLKKRERKSVWVRKEFDKWLPDMFLERPKICTHYPYTGKCTDLCYNGLYHEFKEVK